MITIDSVTRTYGASAAVDDASWTARPGWVTGFLGPNGAGKSTIVRIPVWDGPGNRVNGGLPR
jgi:ABC-2 type transport system ATP-binding protein